jgi:hypothetical protein
MNQSSSEEMILAEIYYTTFVGATQHEYDDSKRKDHKFAGPVTAQKLLVARAPGVRLYILLLLLHAEASAKAILYLVASVLAF